MLRSMTGYGKAAAELEHVKITVEIKTLNSKQLDLNTRLPYIYNEKEPSIRSGISRKIQRGKVHISIQRELTGEQTQHTVDQSVALGYYYQLVKLNEKMKNQTANPDYLQLTMRLPEVIKTREQNLEESEWKALEKTIQTAVKQLDKYRCEEGAVLESDFKHRINVIMDLLAKIRQHEPQRLEAVKEKFNKELNQFIEDKTLDESRYEQEVVYYLEKLDLTEEVVRLKQHCFYFLETLNGDGPLGKKLNFIAQELGREINTIGSKANHQKIQTLVVEMKDELEKIKEQLANIL